MNNYKSYVEIDGYSGKTKKVDKFAYDIYNFSFWSLIMFSCVDFNFGFDFLKFLDDNNVFRLFWFNATLICTVFLFLKDFFIKDQTLHRKIFLFDIFLIFTQVLLIKFFPPSFTWIMKSYNSVYIFKILAMGIVYKTISKKILVEYFSNDQLL